MTKDKIITVAEAMKDFTKPLTTEQLAELAERRTAELEAPWTTILYQVIYRDENHKEQISGWPGLREAQIFQKALKGRGVKRIKIHRVQVLSQ